jgi:outer membrane protein OmpA-like peptidoglycan-associated protein
MKTIRTLAAATILALAAPALWAQGTQLAPPTARISDPAIQADHRAYEALQGRIKRLNDAGRPVRDYHLSKAQCWLDVSFHEYTRNDRSAFPQQAMAESEALIIGMEQGSALGMATPLVNGAARLRPDLWDRTAALEGAVGFRCAQQKVACAEVELVHAGNEFNQQQWRHAKPYVQIAEDLIGEAGELADGCDQPAPPVPAVPAPMPEPAARAAVPVALPVPLPAPDGPAPIQVIQLTAGVLFNFDKHDAGNMRPFSVVQLEDLVRKVQREKLLVQSVRLSGHADRLNGTGQNDYNLRLSEKRVATVKAVLVGLGIDSQLVSAGASGDAQQIQGCEQRFTRKLDLQECLLPNRRVEVVIEARRPASPPGR